MSNVSKVAYVGVCFTMLFTAYIPAQNLVSKIYANQYPGLGQACLFTIFLFQAIGSVFASHIKRKLTHRVAFLIGAVAYCSFVVVATWTAYCDKNYSSINIDGQGPALCKSANIVLLNVGSCLLVGLGAALLWLTQSVYVNTCSTEQTVGLCNSIFWSLMQMSQIVGSGLATLLLGNDGPLNFFKILVCFGIVAVCVFAFLPHVESKQEANIEEVDESLSKSLKKFFEALTRRDATFLFIPMTLIGTTIAFYATFLFKVTNATVDPSDLAKQSYVLLAIAFGEVAAGLSVGRLADKFSKLSLLHATIALPELALILTFLAKQFTNYHLVLAAAFIWGFSDTSLNTMLTAVIGSFYGGSLELFSIMRSLTGVGVVIGAALALLVPDVYMYMFVTAGFIGLLHFVFLAVRVDKSKTEPVNDYASLHDDSKC